MRQYPQIWRLQHAGEKLRIALPSADLEMGWLNRYLPPRAHKAQRFGTSEWRIAEHHFNAIVAACIKRYGKAEIVWDVSTLLKCTEACKGANEETRENCVCCCGGEFHGGVGTPRWKNATPELLVASDTARYIWWEVSEKKTYSPAWMELLRDAGLR